ncbi:MAG: hypothetical protein SFT81_05725 [Candidatus Caenarcaniphilales bacterium]|nr:hypothetical protein [Candidatus Caenarcaniphilales bacterium]
MAFAESYFLVFLLAGLSVASFVFFFFFLPSRGEKHPAVRLMNEMNRIIDRFEKDKDVSSIVNLRKKFQKHKTELCLLNSNEVGSPEDLNRLNKITQALSLYIEGQWRLNELQENDDRVAAYFKRALDTLSEIKKDELKITLVLEDEDEEQKVIEIEKPINKLTELTKDQISRLTTV